MAVVHTGPETTAAIASAAMASAKTGDREVEHAQID